MISFAAPLAGLAAADRQLMGSATRIAQASATGADVDIAAEAVSLRAAKQQRAASVKVARVLSDTLGTLLDTIA